MEAHNYPGAREPNGEKQISDTCRVYFIFHIFGKIKGSDKLINKPTVKKKKKKLHANWFECSIPQ